MTFLEPLSFCKKSPLFLFMNVVGSMNVGNLVLALPVTAITVFFIFYGSGKDSVDYCLKIESSQT